MSQPRFEQDFDSAVASWVRDEKHCDRTELGYRFGGLACLTADVAGWRDSNSAGRARLACEVKAYPYPVGTLGYGSIGQALVLTLEADLVYVCCVASRLDERTWRVASETSTMQGLFAYCGERTPGTFDAYLIAAQRLFECFYRGLGIGFLIVHADENGGLVVRELVKADVSRARPPLARTSAGVSTMKP